MHDGKRNELLVRGETIHRRGPMKAIYIPNLLPSLRFLRLVIFFALLLAVARAAVPQPPTELPSSHWQTRSWWGNSAACMRRSNSAMKLMCCIRGEYVVAPAGRGGGPVRAGSGGAWMWSVVTDLSCVYLFICFFIHSFSDLFIHLFIPFPSHRPGCGFQTGGFDSLAKKQQPKDNSHISEIRRKAVGGWTQ